MKNIFKKNQIIITALCIMIAIAGYLSFTNNDKPEDEGTVQTANPNQGDLDALSETDGTDLAIDATDGTDDINDSETPDDAIATVTDDINDEIAAEDNDETVLVEIADDETGDISDDDILAEATDVTDTGELNLEEDTIPGEAVLASTTLDAGYFSSAKISREQMRARNKDTLLLIIESQDVTEAEKKDAMSSYLNITKIAEKENNTEILLEAKGFDGAVVSMDEEDVEVIVNAATITEQQVAIIEDVVKRKTGFTSNHITITPVVVSE